MKPPTEKQRTQTLQQQEGVPRPGKSIRYHRLQADGIWL